MKYEYTKEYQAQIVQRNLDELSRDPVAAKQWMIAIGLLTKDGELPERFR